MILLWAITGPLFGFSDTWQLVINTATTIVTFRMMFLIQNTQNRDSEAMHIKLDELIRVVSNANCALLNLEELTEQELEAIRAEYLALARQAQATLRARAGQARRPLRLEAGWLVLTNPGRALPFGVVAGNKPPRRARGDAGPNAFRYNPWRSDRPGLPGWKALG